MVQRKQWRKKPKDSVHLFDGGAPAEQARRGGDPGSRGGGAAMGGEAFPNYMKATRSSGAKAGRGGGGGGGAPAAPPQRKPARAEVIFAKNPCVTRATCSSSLKGLGGAAAHVCPYAYCSFIGHVHTSVVPLPSFLASQRRLIKTQQSMKLKGVSAFRKPNSGGAGAGDAFFLEIHDSATATAPTMSSDVSDLSTEDVDGMVSRMEHGVFDHQSRGNTVDKVGDMDASVDGSCSSDVISDGLVELFGTEPCRRKVVKDEKNEALVDQDAEDFGACKSDISEELGAKHEENISEDSVNDPSKESSVDDISSALNEMTFEDVVCDPIDEATCQRNKFVTTRRRIPEPEYGEQTRPFNPRAPNFLPVEHGPDAERVDLRHQMTDDRKSAEEWMVDYALRRAVTKLARAQKRKVEMLVQAFETVLPAAPNENKSVQYEDAKKSFAGTATRPWQNMQL